MKPKQQKTWMGGTQCDVCREEITETLMDCKTKRGPWATLCSECYLYEGIGLGMGLGQMYRQASPDGPFLQVRGER